MSAEPGRAAEDGPVLVGYGPEDRGRGALALGRLLAGATGRALVVACVIPDRWGAVDMARGVDRDYHEYLVGLAEQSLAHARETLAHCPVPVRYEVVTARSAPAGLTRTARETGAGLLVAGSSADGPWGHIALGSTTDRMLHSSPIPVALAPRGLRYTAGAGIGRISVAIDGSSASHAVLARAAQLAADVGTALRVVAFAVRTGTMYPPEVGLHAEDRVVEAWREQTEELIRDAVGRLDVSDCEPQLRVSEGRSWAQALEEPGWQDGEVLVIGSSSSESRLSRVFLGSTATRIIRHSPVPVVVVP